MARPIQTQVMRGQVWEAYGIRHRVMGVVDGYVVFRRKGCMPSLRYYKDFEQTFTLVTQAQHTKEEE